MRIAFAFGSIPTRNNQETDLQRAVVDKKDWLGQEAEYVAEVLGRRQPGSATSIHVMYPVSGEAESNGVEWYATRPPSFMMKPFFYQGKQWSSRWMNKILDWKPDLVHWHMNSYAYTFHLASRRLVKAGMPYVYQHHAAYLAKKPWVRRILRYPHRMAKRGIYSISYYEKQYREGLGLDPSKSTVIPVGYDESFHKMDRDECRRITKFEGDPVLFWCHGLTHRKDPLTVLKAYEQVIGEFPKSHFYMAGSGPIADQVGAYVQQSEALRTHVTLMGYVNNSDVPPMANAADIFIMASHMEPYGIASMEAMACGAFPVLSAIPSMYEQTDNGRLGLLFEPGDVEDCTAKLRRAMGDVEFREAIRAQLPEATKPRSWGQTAERLVDLYEDVLGLEPTRERDGR
ncbi:MAG: glycosyltransferase family 1 protein [Planctomycetes bacterium]|nr:glycosyltransferase family 1 protein [Planctomycetota bacterium]NOG54255.1 glycosyltransferase family 4 protein [Planctomycetota bacterium]